MRTRCAVAALLVVALFPLTARAQEKGKAGLVLGVPASFGVIWQAGDKVAIRPEMTFSWSSNDSTSSVTSSGSSGTSSIWQIGVGASALFYVARHDNLRPYFSPQWRYSHLSGSSTGSGSSTSGNGNQVNGVFGAQYALGSRFSVFGETGAAYSWTTTTVTGPTVVSGVPTLTFTQHSKGVGLTGRVGVIFYF